MGQSLKSQSGASIVEIIITLLIIAVTTLIIMSFSRNMLGMSKDARGSDVAYIAAEQKISELATKTYFASDTGYDSVRLDNIKIYRGWKITDTCFIRRARVTAYFTSLRGATSSIRLSGAIN
jgi:Tfp pilus assembly protein PilV